MMKWIKRLILYPLLFIFAVVILLCLFSKPVNGFIKGMLASKLQWYGYEEKGNAYNEASLSIPAYQQAQIYHSASVQNTKIGNYDEAIRYLDRAVELDSANFDGYYGWVLFDLYRDYEKALFHLERLDRSTDFVDYVSDYNILHAKAICYKQLGEYDTALRLFKEAIQHELEQHSEEWVTHQMSFQTGRTLHLMNRLTEAIPYYDKALQNWDGSSESNYYRGLANIELGNNDGCTDLHIALKKVKRGIKSSDNYIKRFDEIYEGQVQKSIAKLCVQD